MYTVQLGLSFGKMVLDHVLRCTYLREARKSKKPPELYSYATLTFPAFSSLPPPFPQTANLSLQTLSPPSPKPPTYHSKPRFLLADNANAHAYRSGTPTPPANQSLLTQLKILMTSFDSLPPMGREGPTAGRERTLARDVMEVAVFLSARAGDSDAFQRHMAQVC